MKKQVIWKSHKIPKNDNVIYLDRKDINHLDRIYQKYNIAPSSINKVCIEFLCDRHPLFRYMIKELDILLCINDKFEITGTHTTANANYIRSISQIKYEFSVATNGRYRLIEEKINKKVVRLKYIKINNPNPQNDTIYRWSFGIITNGQKRKKVEELVDSIIYQKIPEYEIIICGPFSSQKYKNIDNIIVLDDVIENGDIRAPITKKKNKIAEKAKYNNLCIMHDRYLLPDKWFVQMKKYGNYFDILSMPNIGPGGGRVVDWSQYNTKPGSTTGEHKFLLNYNNWSDGWYCQGGLLIIKKHLYKKNTLDENLYWGELEDVQFSQIANLKGLFYYFDIGNSILTESSRLGESKNNSISILGNIRLYIGAKKTMFKQFLVSLINKWLAF